MLNDPNVGDPEWVRAERITSFAGYPLIVEDRVVGVMAMFSRAPLAKATVTVSNLNHTWPGDIDMLLVSPAGKGYLTVLGSLWDDFVYWLRSWFS